MLIAEIVDVQSYLVLKQSDWFVFFANTPRI